MNCPVLKQVWITRDNIIGIHPDVVDIAKLADADYLLPPRGVDDCQIEILETLLAVAPIVTSKFRGKDAVIAGFRSYAIVQSIRSKTSKTIEFPVWRITSRTNLKMRREIAACDTFFRPLIHTLGPSPAGQLGTTWMSLSSLPRTTIEGIEDDPDKMELMGQWLKKVMKNTHSAKTLAAMMNVSRNTLLPSSRMETQPGKKCGSRSTGKAQ